MIVFDLFEQDPNFRKPVEYETRKQFGTVNLANFIKAYERNQPVQFDFPGPKSYKLTTQWVDLLGDYYNTLETNADKAQLVYGTLTDYNKTIRLLNDLAQSKLFEKKSSAVDGPDFKSTKLSRLKTQARAKYPAANSDMEALVADFVNDQEDDKKQLDKVKSINVRQDELLKQITAINQAQDQEIDSIGDENSSLQKNLNQIRTANAELAKKLADMSARRTSTKQKTEPAVTTSVGNVDLANEPTAPELTAPAEPTKDTGKSAMSNIAKTVTGPGRQTGTTTDTSIDSTTEVPTVIYKPDDKVIDVLPNIPNKDNNSNVLNFPARVNRVTDSSSEQDDLFARTGTNNESINEADTIPTKSVIQGYTVEYNPTTRQVTVSRRGQVIGKEINRSGSANNHLTLINRIIDRAEDDKYPTDIDDRDVALPMKKASQPMRAKALQESGPETWTVYFTDGTKTRVRVPNDETNPTQVKAYFAKKGKTVDRFDYTSAEPNTGSKPEPHEPGSSTAVSARTGKRLPEADTFNRGGNNKLRDKNDYYDKREYLAKQLDTPGYSYADRQLIRDRMMQLEKAARMQGFVK